MRWRKPTTSVSMPRRRRRSSARKAAKPTSCSAKHFSKPTCPCAALAAYERAEKLVANKALNAYSLARVYAKKQRAGQGSRATADLFRRTRHQPRPRPLRTAGQGARGLGAAGDADRSAAKNRRRRAKERARPVHTRRQLSRGRQARPGRGPVHRAAERFLPGAEAYRGL